MGERFTVVGLGEALYDVFPTERRLGGAPLNVAVAADQLAQVRGGRGVPVSRVGQDDLGEQALAELQERGISTDYIQTDPDRATGRVYVDFDIEGQPSYEIVRDVAWDVIQFDPDLEDLAQRCEAVCFGTLAQRDAQSRNAIHRFLDTTRRATLLFDVNLRPPFYDHGILLRSCERATVVKLNQQELVTVADLMGITETGPEAQIKAMIERFDLEAVVLTRGVDGTQLHTPSAVYDGEPTSYEAATNADAVGAGDACSAGVLLGRVLRMSPQQIVNLANHCGAYVASQPGATPALPQAILDMVGGHA